MGRVRARGRAAAGPMERPVGVRGSRGETVILTNPIKGDGDGEDIGGSAGRHVEVKDDVREAGVAFLSEFEGHPSLRQRIADGYQIVTF